MQATTQPGPGQTRSRPVSKPPLAYKDKIPPQEGVFRGVEDIDAKAREIGFRDPLPDTVRRLADQMRLHYRPDGSPMLMHEWGELVHAEDLPAGGVRLPTRRVSSDDLRVLVLGDSGTGDDDQDGVAAGLRRFAADDAHASHFVLHVGDAIYKNGVRSEHDPKLGTHFEAPYGPLERPVYLALGNHEYGSGAGSGDTDALLAWAASGRSAVCEMPARYYAFDYEFGGGRADFFVLDSNTLASDPEQVAWLERELKESEADFKIVVGHHPVKSGGSHGDSPHLGELLLPILNEHADLYVSGHEHDQQLLLLDGGTPQLISGAGAHTRETGRAPETLAASSEPGFARLDFTDDGLRLGFVRATDGKTLFETLLEKGRADAPRDPASVRARVRAGFAHSHRVHVDDAEVKAGVDALFAYHDDASFFGKRFLGMDVLEGDTSAGPLEFQLAPNRHYDPKKGGLEEAGCPCPFCRQDEPVGRALTWRGWRVLPNRYPYAPRESQHTVLAAEGHRAQGFAAQDLADMIAYQALTGPCVTMHYNGIAGNSQQHLHWHATHEQVPLERLLDEGALPLDARRQSAEGSVSTYDEGFYRGLVIEGAPGFVTRWGRRVIDELDEDPAVRGHYNLLLLRPEQQGRARLIVVPRRADNVKIDVEGLGPMSYGALGVAGRGVLIRDHLPEGAAQSFAEGAAVTVVPPDEIPGLGRLFGAPESDALSLLLAQKISGSAASARA